MSDEEDDGDTVGSVLRGFLALRKRDPVTRYLELRIVCFVCIWDGLFGIWSVLLGSWLSKKKSPGPGVVRRAEL